MSSEKVASIPSNINSSKGSKEREDTKKFRTNVDSQVQRALVPMVKPLLPCRVAKVPRCCLVVPCLSVDTI